MGKKTKAAVKRKSKNRRIKRRNHQDQKNMQCMIHNPIETSSNEEKESTSDSPIVPNSQMLNNPSNISIDVKHDKYFSNDPLAIRFTKWRAMKRYIKLIEKGTF